jgi:EmrB/QacA subfamily drug resistance transporter
MTQASRLPCDEAAVRHVQCVPAASAAQKRWVLAASILGSSLAFIDGTIANVALPAIQRELSATVYQAQWVIESYALLLAALLLIGGSVGDLYGRRRVFLAGVAVFGVASLACALSGTVHQLIAARALQGVGAALLVPGSLALISASFPQAERGKAFGTWAGFTGVTSGAGPLLGGWLIDQLSWAWAFAVNVPLALLVWGITWARVPESRDEERQHEKLDLVGALLATLGLGGIVFAFIEAPSRGWQSPMVMAALVVGIAALSAFTWAERAQPSPMLPLALLRNREFAGANLLTLLLYAALGGGLFFLPLNLIQVQGLSATAAGAALLPFILVMFVLSRWAGGLVDRHGARRPLVVGPLIAAAGFALLALPGTRASYWTGFLPGIAVMGLGMAIAVAPLTTTVMNAVEPSASGTASGVNNAVSRVAGLLAIAIFGWLMASVFEPRLQAAMASAGLRREVADAIWSQRDNLAAIALPPGLAGDAAAAARDAVHQAFVAGYRWIMVASAGLSLASAAVAALWIGGPRRPTLPELHLVTPRGSREH